MSQSQSTTTTAPAAGPSADRALTLHPIVEKFPVLSAADFAALKADIKTYGQRAPIVAVDGKIVDGRHRWQACLELEITPKVIDVSGDPIAIARSLNLIRRHMSADQIAACFIELSNTDPKTKAAVETIKAEAKARQHAGGTQGGARPSLSQSLPQSPLQSRDRKGQASIDGLVIVDVDPPAKKRAPTAAGTIAKTLKVSESSMRRTEKAAKLAPEKLKDIVAGTTTSTKILREHAGKKTGAPVGAGLQPGYKVIIAQLEALSSVEFARRMKGVATDAPPSMRRKVGLALDDGISALSAYHARLLASR